ncbi:hypothetical protein F5X68DRAFT_238683 [Plectosphaerella plurivora]|uniref:Uncharacterized protein n=1 Tax=Plectosphaerella plurivora TaxID=936078 RepID=A0A9P8VNQ8_9PEZI|nr:hypothetical protein F5X68DRAFT_238683 [Plectosphaerella plurivora]
MPDLPVYTGFWRNWGARDGTDTFLNLHLTVSRSDGAVITAFLALFLSAAVAQIWPIFCFIIHQARSTTSKHTGLYHQQQAILSNTFSPTAAAVSFLKLAGSCLVILAAAGLATSRVQLISGEVLTRSDTCGWSLEPPYPYDSMTNVSQEEVASKGISLVTWGRWAATNSLEYVRNSYRDSEASESEDDRESAEPGKCRQFAKSALPTNSASVPCPFAEDICGLPEAFQVETGKIDSNRDLGINSNAADRLLVRKVLTCVPINAEEKHSTEWLEDRLDSHAYLFGEKYKYYNLGNQSESLDYTWIVGNYSVSASDAEKERQVISLGAAAHLHGTGRPRYEAYLQPFTPIPDLQVKNADVTVLILGNNARYNSPVDDPWFRAKRTTDQTGAARRMEVPVNWDKAYISDRLISTLGCTEEYQFCTGETCSEMGGIQYHETNPYFGLELSDAQKAVFNLVHNALTSVLVARGVTWTGPSVLRAHEFLWYGNGEYLSTSLPPDHWKSEVTNFMHLMMAVTQRLVVEYATKSDVTINSATGQISAKTLVYKPKKPEEQELCNRIRVRDARFTNFSVVGLVATLLIGGLVTLVNLCILPGGGFWLMRKLGVHQEGEQEWRHGHLFMQQKVALETTGYTRVNEKMGVPWMMPGSEGVGAGLLEQPRQIHVGEEEVGMDKISR